MKSNKPKIYSINTGRMNDFIQFIRCMESGDYNQAIRYGESAIKHLHNEIQLYTGLAICYSHQNNPKQALRILRRAELKFANDANVHYYLGDTLLELKEFKKANESFIKSIELTSDDDNKSLSEALNGRGVALWQMNFRDDAVELWKKSVDKNPANKAAQNNLRDFTNEYGEAKAPTSLFDDIYHFRNIHLKRYYSEKQKAEFDSEEEANKILALINNKWNSEIVPDRKKLDRLSAKEKTVWFEDISINFDENVILKSKIQVDRSKEIDFNFLSEHFDERFDFLPKGSFALLLLAALPLEMVGIDIKRIEQIVRGIPPTEDEKQLLLWAFDLVNVVLDAFENKGKPEYKKHINKALVIAKEVFDQRIAKKLVNATEEYINEFLKQGKKYH